MSVLSAKEIMEIIPHRQPFMLIDTVEELEPGIKAVAKKCVSYNEPYFAGHFPEGACYAGRADYRGAGADGCGGNFEPARVQRKDGLFCGNQFGEIQGQSDAGGCPDAGDENRKSERAHRRRRSESLCGRETGNERGAHICNRSVMFAFQCRGLKERHGLLG